MKPDLKEMSNKVLTQYFLANRQDKEALKELKSRKGDISIRIPGNLTPEDKAAHLDKLSDVLKDLK